MAEILPLAAKNCARKGLSATIILAGIEGRETLSEGWTSQGGKLILAEVAQALREGLQNCDTLGLITHEQFGVFMMGYDPIEVAERVGALRERVKGNLVLESIGVRLEFESLLVDSVEDGFDLHLLLEMVSANLERARGGEGTRDAA